MSETPSPPKRKGKRHRHRWRPHAGQQRHGETAARILRAQDELVHAVREIYAEMFGVQPGLAKPFSLDLSVKILPGASWAL